MIFRVFGILIVGVVVVGINGGDFCELTVEEDQAELLDRTVGMLENSEQPMEGDSDGHRTTSVFIASVHPRYVQNYVQIQKKEETCLAYRAPGGTKHPDSLKYTDNLFWW